MTAGFARYQLKKLASPLDPSRVQSRMQDGKSLSYIEGWFVLAEANRIFGYDGWDREMVHCEKVFERKSHDGMACGYLARVRVRVRASDTTILREGSGFGQALAESLGDAHERALKAAETDATKRALVTFGGRFGLMLYDKEQRALSAAQQHDRQRPGAGHNEHDARGDAKLTSANISRSGAAATSEEPATPKQPSQTQTDTLDGSTAEPREPSDWDERSRQRAPYRLVAADGSSTDVQSPEGFCSALRQLIEAARNISELARLRWQNEPTLFRLRQMSDLASPSGQHYGDILERLMAARANTLTSELTALQTAIARAKPVEPAESPKIYEPFVPIPAYPLARLRQRFGGTDSKTDDTGDRTEASRPESNTAPPTAPAESVDSSEAALTRRSQITGGFSIDKSVLRIPSERRLRSKRHLQFVASKPCLICEALPSQAHHLTFAQPRGLSQKVSDEFTVPLCGVHHNELHASGNEMSWWRDKGIEPLLVANLLWRTRSDAQTGT